VAAILRFPLEIDAEEEEEPIDLVRQQGHRHFTSCSESFDYAVACNLVRVTRSWCRMREGSGMWTRTRKKGEGAAPAMTRLTWGSRPQAVGGGQ
jgi:hypothetical protein